MGIVCWSCGEKKLSVSCEIENTFYKQCQYVADLESVDIDLS